MSPAHLTAQAIERSIRGKGGIQWSSPKLVCIWLPATPPITAGMTDTTDAITGEPVSKLTPLDLPYISMASVNAAPICTECVRPYRMPILTPIRPAEMSPVRTAWSRCCGSTGLGFNSELLSN